MLRCLVAIQVLLLLVTVPAAAGTIDDVDRLFGYGANHPNERQALQLIEAALKESPNDYQLLWRTARSLYYTADGLPTEKERIKLYERAMEIGERAVAQNPNGVEGHFWLAASVGGFCREKGGISAFKQVKKVRTGMEMVLKLNDEFEEGAAYMALGEIDRQLPGLFGGNLKRSIATLEKGMQVAPTNPEIKYALAESYREANRKADARKQIQELLELPLNSPRANEYKRAQENARKLLAKLK